MAVATLAPDVETGGIRPLASRFSFARWAGPTRRALVSSSTSLLHLHTHTMYTISFFNLQAEVFIHCSPKFVRIRLDRDPCCLIELDRYREHSPPVAHPSATHLLPLSAFTGCALSVCMSAVRQPEVELGRDWRDVAAPGAALGSLRSWPTVPSVAFESTRRRPRHHEVSHTRARGLDAGNASQLPIRRHCGVLSALVSPRGLLPLGCRCLRSLSVTRRHAHCLLLPMALLKMSPM